MDLTSRTNAKGEALLGALGPHTAAQVLDDAMPVLATPAAAAVTAGIAVIGAGAAGFAAEEASDG